MLSIDSLVSQYPDYLRQYRTHILREYLQYKVLEAVFATKMAKKLIFLGGTALRIVYENTRFSEDIDFDNFGLTLEEFESLTSEVKRALELEGFEVEMRLVSKNAYRAYIRFPSIMFEQGLTTQKQEKILIQIDTVPHYYDYQAENKILNKFDVFTQIYTTPLPLLMAQKIYAAFNRKRAKGRDFFDLVFLAGITKPHYGYLKEKLDIADSSQLKSFIKDKVKDLDFKQLADDVRPFLFKPQDSKKVELFGEYAKTVEWWWWATYTFRMRGVD